MNIIFLRHGEATDNVKELISDKEIYWSVLTEKGMATIKESIKSLPKNLDKLYVSPLPRTIQTAHFIHELYPNIEVIIENRLREIYHGKYTHMKNNKDLDDTRIKQINGDYFVRLGQYGENNYEIEERLCAFLNDVYKNNFKNNTVLIVSHGSITSYMKRILKVKTPHLQTGKLEIFDDVDFKPLFNHIKHLKRMKKDLLDKRINLIKNAPISDKLKQNLNKFVKKEFNNLDFTNEMFDEYIGGLNTNNLKQLSNSKFFGNIILVCFYTGFENFAEIWINHYLKLGIKNYVLVGNNIKDDTNDILKKYIDKANISFWNLDEKYNCNKMCGWKQRIFEFYGTGNIYITVDSDELLIYKDYKNISIDKFIKKEKLDCAKSLMLDVYTDKKLYDGKIEDYKYVDQGTYRITSSVTYGQRFFGGPRLRMFNITPNLQKIPLMKYSGNEIFANDHFYYPWSINDKAKFCTYLLHYKFLPGDYKKYEEYANDGRHWNNSREYKIYTDKKIVTNKTTFYDKDISILIDDLKFDF